MRVPEAALASRQIAAVETARPTVPTAMRTISTPTIHAYDTPGVKLAQAATSAALISAFTVSARRNP